MLRRLRQLILQIQPLAIAGSALAQQPALAPAGTLWKLRALTRRVPCQLQLGYLLLVFVDLVGVEGLGEGFWGGGVEGFGGVGEEQ